MVTFKQKLYISTGLTLLICLFRKMYTFATYMDFLFAMRNFFSESFYDNQKLSQETRCIKFYIAYTQPGTIQPIEPYKVAPISIGI